MTLSLRGEPGFTTAELSWTVAQKVFKKPQLFMLELYQMNASKEEVVKNSDEPRAEERELMREFFVAFESPNFLSPWKGKLSVSSTPYLMPSWSILGPTSIPTIKKMR